MADSHPSLDTLEMFLRGQLPQHEIREVVGHLLTDCSTCQEVTGKGWVQLLDGLKANRNDSSVSKPVEASLRTNSPYSRALGRAMGHALDEARAVDRNCAAAEHLFEELMKHPPKRRLTLVRNSRRFQSPELCQLLIDKGYDRRFAEVHLGVELTELAVAVGQQLDDEALGPAETSDLVGRAWAYHGNALRVASDLRLADKALQEARQCFAEGVGGDLDKALVCRFSALLLRARRDFEEAHSLQDHAIKLYLRHGETRVAARVLADQALGVVYAGEPDKGYCQLRASARALCRTGR